MSENFEKAKNLFVEGVRCFEAGEFERADEHFRASLVLVPARVSTLANLAATRIRLGQPREALDLLQQVLAAEPDDVDAWFHRGTALRDIDRHEEALVCFDKVLSLDPTRAQAWVDRGSVLKDLRRLGEAAVSFEQAMAHGADAEVMGYLLASVTGRQAPGAAPQHYVRALFDDYADSFDEHLVRVLHYQAHTVLTENLKAVTGRRFERALDLGCGTGLCGPLIRPVADALDGVDLAGRMIEKARTLGVYDRLVLADATDYLQTTGERYDLILSADVFIYIGDLAPIFGGVARVAKTGAMFCFSAECADDGKDYELRPSQRFAHSQRYLRGLATQHGFEVVKVVHHAIREDQRQPIAGLFAYLMKSS